MFNKPILKLFLTVHNFSGRAKILNSIFKKNEPVLKNKRWRDMVLFNY